MRKTRQAPNAKGSPEDALPPKSEEYLPAAINGAVIDFGLKHPATLYPLALGTGAAIAGWVLNLPTLYLGAGAGFFMGILWATISIFFRHEKIGSRYIQGLNRRQAAYEQELKRRLTTDLNTFGTRPGIVEYAHQGKAQLKNIELKYKNIKDLLEMKIGAHEITFGRFLGAAEQVSLSVHDNIRRVVSILKSATSIQTEEVQRRLADLEGKQNPTDQERDQQKALRQRLELWREQLAKVGRLLANNEMAMTEMEKISAAVAQWQTENRFADTDFESAIKSLHALAEQAQDYNV
jgi:hypothetical protein